jgi:endonuclease/exonuclease/phosphatase (EEP) superfamily protein YafD
VNLRKPSFTQLFVAACYGLFFSTLLLNDVWPVALLTNFYLHLFVGFLVVGSLLYSLDRPAESLAVVGLALLVILTWVGTIRGGLLRYENLESTVRLGVFNPGLRKPPVRRAIDEARRRNVEIQIFIEANPAVLKTLSKHRPSSYRDSDYAIDGRYGMAVMSRIPLDATRMIQFEQAPFPVMEVVWSRDGRTIRCWGIHPAPPVSPRLFQARNRFFAELLRRMNQPGGPDMVVGDFNATPSSFVFRRLLERPGWNWIAEPLAPTWPAGIPWMGVRIDHLMFRDDLGVTDYEVGPDLGSDHYPIYGTVGFRTSSRSDWFHNDNGSGSLSS